MALILASGSPRRKELLRLIVPDFLVEPADVDERVIAAPTPAALVRALALAKCRAVAALRPGDLVLGCDTVVDVDGRVLGKPADPEDAVRMLTALSGREHTVYTGVTIRRGGEEATEHEATAVRFRPLTPEEIRTYVSTGEPMDKAGSYGIQGYGCLLVEGIRGDYFNVVGLPVCRLGRMLARFGIEPLALAAEKERAL